MAPSVGRMRLTQFSKNNLSHPSQRPDLDVVRSTLPLARDD